jgi:uncharacterized repeat protein (TIGR03837 family)
MPTSAAASRPPLVDLACRVVDNFGDIGVVYRLARALSDLPAPPRLRLVVDDLAAFAALAPGLDQAAPLQSYRGWTVVRWTDPGPAALADYEMRPCRALVEAFACGRPDWLEERLFDPADPVPRRVVNLEYLSAEAYAAELHRLPTPTRSSLVRKHIFSPGFTPATGGLIQDAAWRAASERAADPAGRLALRRALAAELALAPAAVDAFWLPVFCYQDAAAPLAAGLAAWSASVGAAAPPAADPPPLLVLAAAGAGQAPFLAAWEAAGRPFALVRLPFLAQESWDRLLAAADCTVVRGEDSFSRAALAGIPFLWNVYPIPGGHHLPKMEAWLARLQPYFAPADFAPLAALERALHAAPTTPAAAAAPGAPGAAPASDRAAQPEAPASNRAAPANPGAAQPEPPASNRAAPASDRAAQPEAPASLGSLLDRLPSLAPGFAAAAADCRALGDLAAHLMTFFAE